MAFLEELKDRAVDLAQTGVAKSRQMAEIAKLNMDIVAKENAIRAAYQKIGEIYYQERGLAPDAAYVALCGKITEAKTTIEENKSHIAELKAETVPGRGEETGVITDVPPEEPVGGCGCGCGTPEEPAQEHHEEE